MNFQPKIHSLHDPPVTVAQYEKHVHLQKANSAKIAAAKAGYEDGSDDDIYTVERIVDKKKVGTKTHYLVKWEGYPME